ncbi:glycoside hydrolase family 32 protein [Dactylosporangium sp. NPDC005555]|uniref:glycoside hydrolase family 32 protein n=1 Tax=Dactylosporangium sp. NPDC005555 TaxID=3154889 RepID=UPI0033AA121C
MRTVRFRILLVPAILIAVLVPASAQASPSSDYPEFPYPATAAYDEPYRGQFHFSSRSGWMNDVNAPLYYNGLYHLFYQHNPHGLAWDTMHWGHATSPDLVHWTQKPVSLEPGVHPGDLFSGAGVVDTTNTSGLRTGADAPIVAFTGTNGVSIVYSTDGARTFQSYDRGRKVVVPSGTSRDPKVLWDAARGRWVMVVWSDGGGNGVNVYTSTNLLDWTYRSRFSAGWLFECPDFFSLAVDGNTGNTRWVMTDASGEYVTGTFDGAAFTPDFTAPQRMDQGRNAFDGSFYAGLVFSNMPDGRTVQMAWQPGNHGATWTGNASFPAQLRLISTPAGPRITRLPVAEIASLRFGTTTWSNRTVTTDPATDPFAGITADTYEILAEFDVGASTATQFGFQLHRRADGGYDRAVAYDRAAQTLYGAPLAPVNGRVKVRLLVDRGQLEVFGNDGRLSYTDNVNFNSAATSQGIRLFATGGSARLVSAEFHRLRSAWGQGEPTLESNLAGPWRPVAGNGAGSWGDTAAGKRGTAGGDAFYLSDTTAADFTYEGDVTIESGTAAAITFRANADATQHYTANIDASGVVKLWRPGRVIATYPTAVVPGRTYHLKVVTAGASIKVYLDHGATPVIDATDTAYAGGYLGANVFNGTGTVQNLTLNGPGFSTNLAGPWQPVNGTWTTTAPRAGAHGTGAGDTFYLSRTVAADLTYEGDLTIVNGTAAALTFRANADATQHYSANIDASGVVKLWRPGRDIGTYPTAIVPGRTYHLKVVAVGASIKVYLGNGTTPVIDATDTAYSSGYLGANVYDGSAVVQRLNRS